jgi:hypothetical protein
VNSKRGASAFAANGAANSATIASSGTQDNLVDEFMRRSLSSRPPF